MQLRPRCSRLFAPGDTLGVVCTGAVSHFTAGTSQRLIAAADRHYVIYDVQSLQPRIRSVPLPSPVTAVCGADQTAFAALEDLSVLHFSRLQLVTRYYGHKDVVRGLLHLNWGLLSWSDSEMLVWDFETKGLMHRLDVERLLDSTISVVHHPPGFRNKVLVATTGGAQLQLWNVLSGRCIHTFKSVCDKGDGVVSIASTLHPSCAVLGFTSGKISLLNIVADEIVTEVFQHEPVTAVAALTCVDCSKPGLILSGDGGGTVIVWDLEKREVLHKTAVFDNAKVCYLFGVPGELLFLATSKDNSLVLHSFDTAEQRPRLLKERRGLPGPVRFLAPYDETSKELLAVGSSSSGSAFVDLVNTSVFGRHWRFGQTALASINAKLKRRFLPEPIGMCYAFSRHFDWPNIATIHKGVAGILVWSGHDRRLIPRLIQPPLKGQRGTTEDLHVRPFDFKPSALGVSLCGNFLVAGCMNGSLWKFNLQSGHCQGQFSKDNCEACHNGPIAALEIHNASRVVSAGGTDGELRVWDLGTGHRQVSVEVTPDRTMSIQGFETRGVLTAVRLHTVPGAQEEFSQVQIVDLGLKRIVRTLPKDKGIITGCAWSPDGRWIAVARDNQIEIWDLLATARIDWLQLPDKVTSIRWSTIKLWVGLSGGGISALTCRRVFQLGTDTALLRPIESPLLVGIGEAEEDLEPEKEELPEDFSALDAMIMTAEMERGVCEMTLSNLSAGQLQALVHWDVLKERNSLKAARANAKSAADAPFFLPSTYTEDNKLQLLPQEFVEDKLPANDVSMRGSSSALQNRLAAFSSAKSTRKKVPLRKDLTTWLSKLSPAALHLEIADLGPAVGGTEEELVQMLAYLHEEVYARKDADFVQSVLQVFLQMHNESLEEIIRENDELKEKVQCLRKLIQADWNGIQTQLDQLSCFLKLLTQTQMEAVA